MILPWKGRWIESAPSPMFKPNIASLSIPLWRSPCAWFVIRSVLIAVNNDDIVANQAKFLFEMGGWQQVRSRIFPSYSNQHARMWFLPNRILWQDDLDKRWSKPQGRLWTKSSFLSSCKKSGKPCLTLHPIGVPHHPLDEEPPFGGNRLRFLQIQELLHGGDSSPKMEFTSNSWIFPLPWSYTSWTDSQCAESFHWGWFDWTLLAEEATNSWQSSMMVWVWTTSLRLGMEFIIYGHPVLITLGGGHYAPKANKLALEQTWLGICWRIIHYHLVRKKTRELFEAVNRCRNVINEPRLPGGKIVCNVEKKSFKGWQRQLIYAYLEELGVEVVNLMRSWKWSKDAKLSLK